MRSTKGEWASNLHTMLETLEIIKQLPVIEPGLYVHMGCGPQVLPGWLNVDKYHEHPDVLQADMANPPLPANTARAIYSSHSLEHLNFRPAIQALQNWYRLLQPGGTLFLAIPDLEETMRIMLDPDVDWGQKWGWYVYTLFGVQADADEFSKNRLSLDLADDPGQHHRCGFTKESITRFLEGAGYTIRDLYNYDGWSTPSIFVEAVKG